MENVIGNCPLCEEHSLHTVGEKESQLLQCIWCGYVSSSAFIGKREDNEEYIIVKNNFENNECIICLEEMVINNKMKILECGHIYHYKCINNWFKKKNEINCPLCS